MDFSKVLTDITTLTWLALFIFSLALVSLHYGRTYLKVGRYRKNKRKNKAHGEYIAIPPVSPMPPVSVVLTVHNDANWMKDNLVYLLEQDYPQFEVVVVDYLSQDDTQFVLKICKENYKNLKVVSFPEDVNMFQGKKYPLSIGIREAKYDIVLLTEADSVPCTFNWIREMMATYHPATKMMLGYCGIKQEKGLFNLLQQYDNLEECGSAFSATLHNRTYTAFGRNLAYRRSFFFDRKGFCAHYTEPFGADDLFVNQNAPDSEVRLCIQPDAYVSTAPRSTYGSWRRQRRERRSTRHLHPLAERLQRDIYPISTVLLYLTFAMLILGGIFPWQILVGVLALKLAWQIVAFSQLSKRFDIKLVHFFAPFFEIYFLFVNTISWIFPLKKR